MSEYHTGTVLVEGQLVPAAEYMRQQRKARILDKIVGFIYLIRCGDSNYYKIGQSKQGGRLDTLQVGNPYPLKLVCAIGVRGYLTIERELHEHFTSNHVRGEWYELSLEDVSWIEAFLLKLA